MAVTTAVTMIVVIIHDLRHSGGRGDPDWAVKAFYRVRSDKAEAEKELKEIKEIEQVEDREIAPRPEGRPTTV